ncbi:MAG: calcium/sodium antiporter [Pseudomonadota bacterium]
MLTFAGIVLGLVLLIAGGAALVRGASEIAVKLGVSPMIIGLTIVGFGTSSPELIVNVIGALRGETGIAFGNVVGSNISNLGLVLGLSAVIAPIAIQGDLVRRELPLLLLATTMMTVLVLDGPLEGMPAMLGRTDSIVLILMLFIFIYITFLDVMRSRKADPLLAEIEESPVVAQAPSSSLSLLFLLAGFVLLFLGGEVTIRNGVALADMLGVPPTIVGLFVVAVGTSMPELVTSAIAAVRGESDLALGNVIGSNIFNSLMVLPISGLVAQIPAPPGGVQDLAFSWLLAALLVPVFFIGKARFGRGTGAAYLLAYFGYAAWRISAA